jgi:hypothetical protein
VRRSVEEATDDLLEFDDDDRVVLGERVVEDLSMSQGKRSAGEEPAIAA